MVTARMWKVANFKIFSQHLSGMIQDNHENKQKNQDTLPAVTCNNTFLKQMKA
jgi:hypothetical protein